MNFEDRESQDGVRFSWNIFPMTPAQETAISVPLGCLYTPTRPTTQLGQVEYRPVFCSGLKCGAVLNPYCTINYSNKTWQCCLCSHRNHFPTLYQSITPDQRPAEVYPDYSTIEYIVNKKPDHRPCFVYVVDLVLIAEEFDRLKQAIKSSLLLLPDNALVCLITYGTDVHIYDLSSQLFPTSYWFSGEKTVGYEDITSQLNLHSDIAASKKNTATTGDNNPAVGGAANPPPGTAGAPPSSTGIRRKYKFLTPISECEEIFGTILDNLSPETWPYHDNQRPQRCTGVALYYAISLMYLLHYREPGRIMTFVGGPCVHSTIPFDETQYTGMKDGKTTAETTAIKTAHSKALKEAPNMGQICTNYLGDKLRSHHDIQKDDVQYYEPSCQFYRNLSLVAANSEHIIDIMACSLDQVGIAEMYPLVSNTGGELILDDSFSRGVFQGSIKKILQADTTVPDRPLHMVFGAKLKVLTSPTIQIKGALGHCNNLNDAGPSTNTTTKEPIGASGTQSWYLGGLMPDSTFCIYLNPKETGQTAAKQPAPAPAGSGGANPSVSSQTYPSNTVHIQFMTQYRTTTGQVILRVTTVQQTQTDEPGALRQSFDQEAATAIITRLTIHKCVVSPHVDVRRWLDRVLIKLCAKFAFYKQGQIGSFKLTDDFSLYPQFMYYLRRSQLVQIFNFSPDETAFFRIVALKANCSNTLTMIQPRLIAYSHDSQPISVPLDANQLNSERILLLDTFFYLIVWYGVTAASWKSMKLYEREDYNYLNNFFMAPMVEVKQQLQSRLPTPRFIECVEGNSQARFMLAKLNPSTGATLGGSEGEHVMFTEDVTLTTFTQDLKKLVVNAPRD